MPNGQSLDCVVIGYNETPFEEYERLIQKYGEDSEAYRDLKYSFVEIDGKKLNYIGLLNYVFHLANYNGDNRDFREEFKSCEIPNLAAVYLTHYLKKRGYNVQYINLFQHEKEKLTQYLAEDLLCVAITTTFYAVNLPVNEMVSFIRKHNLNVKIIVGGPLIQNHTRNYKGGAFTSVLEDIGADIYVIESQGELTLSRIVKSLKTGGSISDIPNLVYFENGKLRRTMDAPENNSLDENYIDWHLFSNEDLGDTLQTRTARSCAFNCAFCNYPTRAGKLTLASLDTIERELDSMHDRGNVKNVVFIDDTFNVPLKRFKEICQLIIQKDYQFNWFSYFRCSNSDEEAVELMAKSGCKGVFLGIESGSETILKNMNKVATVEKYVSGIKSLHQHNILTFASLIIGFPGETHKTVNETINFIKETKPQYYRAQLWYCEGGTPIEQQRDKYGIIGDGFVWRHNTMDSLEAMDYIDKMFLTIDDSVWLPQWSFDFWTIPYLLGKGISLNRLRNLMVQAHKLLALEIAYVPEYDKTIFQQEHLQHMLKSVKD